jgi:hypothetical protein
MNDMPSTPPPLQPILIDRDSGREVETTDTPIAARMIRTAYWLGDVVYLRVRTDRIPGLIAGIVIRPGTLIYIVCWGNSGAETWHYEIELTAEYVPDFGA